MSIEWQLFPRSLKPPQHLVDLVRCFETGVAQIDSEKHSLKSNDVLEVIEPSLSQLGYRVETGKKAAEKVHVPVLFGRNGAIDKAFEADAWHEEYRTVLEVEAGRAVANNQFLKDLFQACMLDRVEYCAIAVRNTYKGSQDFERVCAFFETLYASARLPLPLKGVLIIGY